jgi:hypothetical protein
MIDLSEECLGRTQVVGHDPVQVAREVNAEKFLARFRSFLELPHP